MARLSLPAALIALVSGGFLLGLRPSRGVDVAGVLSVAVGLLLIQRSRTLQRRERLELERAAFTDPLTGLANRRMLQLIAQHEIRRHRRDQGRLAVLMLDLDGFKQVNDQLGHDAGDLLLREVGQALSATLRTQDTVARLGGDEFCVVAPETSDPKMLSSRVLVAVSSVIGHRRSLSASAGVAVFPEDGAQIDQLLRVADGRLITAKQRRLSADGRVGSRSSGRGTSRAA